MANVPAPEAGSDVEQAVHAAARRAREAARRLAVAPRAAEAGASIEVAARHADGRVEPLAVVARYEPAYPISYRFQQRVRLRRGAAIEVRSSAPECAAALDFVALQ